MFLIATLAPIAVENWAPASENSLGRPYQRAYQRKSKSIPAAKNPR